MKKIFPSQTHHYVLLLAPNHQHVYHSYNPAQRGPTICEFFDLKQDQSISKNGLCTIDFLVPVIKPLLKKLTLDPVIFANCSKVNCPFQKFLKD